MKKRCLDLYNEAKNNPAGLRFTELQKLCKCAGMWLDRTKGSHYIYKRENPSFMFSIQEMQDGKAKPYQVRQLLEFIDTNALDKRSKDA